MKKAVVTLASIFCVLSMSGASARACGDKLLFLGRIYRHHGNTDPTVAVYARPHSLLQNASAEELSKPFHEDGYHLLLIKNDRDLAMAIQSHAADAVIVDISDMPVIREAATAQGVLVIPVIDKDDSSHASSYKAFVAIVKSPVKTGKFLDAMDRAFESKEAHQDLAKARPVDSALLPR